MNLLKHRINTLRLRENAPFPSEEKEAVDYFKEKHREHRAVDGRPDRTAGGNNPRHSPNLVLVLEK